ncbi:MAG: hypothetical protein ACOZQL_23075 [Myxococcota bacterium]
MTPTTLALLLAVSSVEGQGEAPTLSVRSREHARFQASLHAVGALAVGAGAVGAGPGAAGTLGVLLSDRVALGLRGSVGTTLTLVAASFGVGVDLVLSDHWSLGVGLGLGHHGGTTLDAPYAWAALLPVRVSFSPASRAAAQLERRGLHFFLETAPGYSLARGYATGVAGIAPRPEPIAPLVFAASVGVGYAWW